MRWSMDLWYVVVYLSIIIKKWTFEIIMDLIETYSLRPKNIHPIRLIVSMVYKLADAKHYCISCAFHLPYSPPSTFADHGASLV